jgi:hypothetical protein
LKIAAFRYRKGMSAHEHPPKAQEHRVRGMNPLSHATVEEFRTILKEDYGRDVTPEQASEIAHSLVHYFDLLAEVYHREHSSEGRDGQT